MNYCKFEELKGKVLKEIRRDNSISYDNERLIFVCVDGTEFHMYHDQDCCESVRIEDICGELDDLLFAPILIANESSESGDENSEDHDNFDGSETWTFYVLSTIKGSVTIRWYGTSNGYYSESVSFYKVE